MLHNFPSQSVFKIIGLWTVFTFCSVLTWGQSGYFFPNSGSFDPKIPTPEQFLGYPVGSHFTRHDQIVAYFRELARLSDRVHFQVIGKTYEERLQVVATITAPENYARLEAIRQEHLKLVDPAQGIGAVNQPVVVFLGYSVHGNETSSGEASMLTGYYLAANQSEETQRWLKEAVVFIDPALNPDGRDRAANWHNSYKSFPNTTDPIDKEHVEIWPNGRTNHYLSNLNRDWLSATQVESQNRLAFFHQWYPNVHIDFHEMGANSSYYFEPTPKRTQSPIVPQSSYDFNVTLARYYVESLDKIGSLYFTKEQYDNISPIYGGTYPDFFGGAGFTFEQASSRGFAQESENGILTFPFTIRNHTQMGIATVRGAVMEKPGLFKLQKEFFQSALAQARSLPTKAYVFGDARDQTLTNQFLELLLRHRLQVYQLGADATVNNKKFEKGKTYVVPAEQPYFRIVHSIFEETPPLKDSVYYDNTSWSLIHASGLQFAKLSDPSKIVRGEIVTKLPESKGEVAGGRSSLAYLLPWTEYNASRALFHLLEQGVLVKSAFKPFTAPSSAGKMEFGYGSLVIPVARQTISADSLFKVVQAAANLAEVKFYATPTGYNLEGIDLGSSNVHQIRKPSIAMIVGAGTNFEEVGQVWFLLNQHLHAPISKIDIDVFPRANLNRYNTLVMVSGNYSRLDKSVVARIKSWVAEGGTLILFKNAAEWAIRQELIKERVATDSLETKGPTERIDYVKQEETESARRINGGLFTADIDITNPIAFGLSDRKVVFTKNSQTILLPSRNKYSTVSRYTPAPYISGYVAAVNIKRIANTAAILVSQEGAGKIISFADDPTYRSYWQGTDRLFLNAIFFGNQIQVVPQTFSEESDNH
jgi:hypothetical protein